MTNATKALVAALLFAAGVTMSFAQGVLTKPILADDQMTFYMAERCASGVSPHVAHLEVKTQLPTLISGAAIAIGRRVGVGDVHAGRTASTVAAAAAVVLGWLLALELSGNAAAALVAAAAMLSIFGLFIEAATGFQPKIFLIVFLLAAHLCCARRQAFRTGFLAACALLCWQPGAVVLASCLLAFLLDRRAAWAAVFRLAVGAAVAVFAYEAYFVWQGSLGAQLHQELYLASHAPPHAFDARESIWFVMTEAEGYRHRPDGMPSVFVAVAALLWLGLLARPRLAVARLRDRPGLVSFWTAAHLATAFTLFDHQAHPDMLLVQPYFAVACGIGFAWLAALLARLPGGRVLAPVAALLCIGLGLKDARYDVARSQILPPLLEDQLAMGRLFSLYQDHRGSVWVLGSVHLLGFTHSDNWVPLGNVGHESTEYDIKTYRPLRDGRMPEIIVAGRGLRPGFRSWLPVEYRDITPAVFDAVRIRIFSRRSESDSTSEDEAPKKAPVARSARPPARPQPVKR